MNDEFPRMRAFRHAVWIPLLLVVTSCALFLPTVSFSPTEFSVEELANGYLLRIDVQKDVGDVATLITPGNWLHVTIADTLLDTTRVSGHRSPMVQETLVRRFQTATQFSFRFAKPISSSEISDRKRTILISVFF